MRGNLRIDAEPKKEFYQVTDPLISVSVSKEEPLIAQRIDVELVYTGSSNYAKPPGEDYGGAKDSAGYRG